MTAILWRPTAALLLGATALVLAVPDRPEEVHARALQALVDRDGDLLPDALEWLALSDPSVADSDLDGVDDFLEAVQFDVPGATSGARPLDHEMRLLVMSAADPTGQRDVWLSFLFRFVGSQIGTVTEFEPYLDRWGVRVPLLPLLGCGDCRLLTREVPGQGLYVLFQTRFASENQLRQLLPFTLGVTTTVGGKRMRAGTYLFDTEGTTTALVPIGPDSFAVQTLAQDSGNPFWSSDRYCRYEFDIIGSTPRGHFCEVRKSTCTSGGGLKCPTTCTNSGGVVVFFPDGMGTLTGG